MGGSDISQCCSGYKEGRKDRLSTRVYVLFCRKDET